MADAKAATLRKRSWRTTKRSYECARAPECTEQNSDLTEELSAQRLDVNK
jgi:hypothetical protein